MSNNNNKNSDVIELSADSADFDIMNEPFITTQIINLMMPSIQSMLSSALNTSMCGLSSFVDTPMKDETANHHNTMSNHPKENDATTLM